MLTQLLRQRYIYCLPNVTSPFLPAVKTVLPVASTPVRCNSNRASVTRINRKYYAQMYPTMLVYPDGSTVTIRHKEPRAIIRLPVDLSQLSEADRAARLAKRRPKKKVVIEEDIEDSFDANQYLNMWKKK